MKLFKLSLVAAVAVTSISVANAQDLAKAIKDVDVSGTMAYRYNDYENSDAENNYKLAVSLKSKVNDDVTFNSRFIAGDGTTDPVTFKTNEADETIGIHMSEANFTYTGIANTALTLGKQSIATPFTIQKSAIGDEQVGTGLVATHSINNITVSGAYFNQTNFSTSGNVTSLFTNNKGSNFSYLGVRTSLGSLNLDAYYADASEIFDVYTLGLSHAFKFSDISLSTFARYSALDLDNSEDKNSLWKVGIKAKTGIYGAFFSYGKTHKEGGKVGLDDGADVGFDEHWRVTLTGINDASAIYTSVDAQVNDKFNIALKHSSIDAGADSSAQDQKESYVQLSYKMSSNLKSYIRYGELDVDGSEKATIGRLYIQYSF